MTANPCKRCGADAGAGNPEAEWCDRCPPLPCPDCGQPDNRPCACFVDVRDMPLADLKAVFARSGIDTTLEQP